MADSTINELVNLTNVANNDELVLWDTSANETKKATVSNVVTPVATSTATTVVGTTSGIMATGTCSTAAGTAQKVVTSSKWTNKPGESIMVEFTYENTADDVTLKIGSYSAIPVYALNTSIRLGSGTIPAGPMIFTLSADGTKFYAHTVVVDTAVTSGSSNPITSGAVKTIIDNLPKIVRQYKPVEVSSSTQQGYLVFTFSESLPDVNNRTVIISPVLDNDSSWESYVVTELSNTGSEHNVNVFYRCFLNSKLNLKGFMCTVIY